MKWARATFAVLITFVSGCAVGPDFKQPDAPTGDRYTSALLTSKTASAPVHGGAAQHFVEGKDVPAQWWTLFGSPALDELIESALKQNPNLQAAEAALRVAQENVAAQRGSYFPSVDAHLMPTRQKVADILSSPLADGSTLYTLHTAQLNITYMPDVFGANRRQVESLISQADAQDFQRDAAYLTLISNIAAAAIQEASLRAQIKAARDIIALSEKQLALMKKHQQSGQIGVAEIASQEAALAQAQMVLPPLEKQLAQQRDLLAVLAGRFPSEDLVQKFELSTLTLPEELPLSLPSRLVEQRPDIRAAEAQWHAACAQIGVAKANRFPNLTLTASAGSTALDFSKLFTSGTGFWGIGADLMQPIFRGGTLMHQQRAAEAAYDQAASQYRATVLLAFQNVADTLHAIATDAEALRIAVAAERAAYKSLVTARRQWEINNISYTAVLFSEQTYQQAVIALVQAQANRFADAVALFQALGGGWLNRSETPGVGTRTDRL